MKTEWGEHASGTDAFDLTGKRALVIGAGAPAGRAIALALAEAGATLDVSSITNDGDDMFRAKKVHGLTLPSTFTKASHTLKH